MLVEGNNIILDVFADEAALKRDVNNPQEMFAAVSALGYSHWTPRQAFNEGKETNDNLTVTKDTNWVKDIKKMSSDYGLEVMTSGTPIGKHQLNQGEEKHMSLDAVLAQTEQAIENALILGAKALRGFTGYHAGVDDYDLAVRMAVDMLGPVLEKIKAAGLVYVIEPETGLVAHDAKTMIGIAEKLNSPVLAFAYDPANIHLQAKNTYNEGVELIKSGKLIQVHAKVYGLDVKTPILPSQEGAADQHVAIGRDANQFTRFTADLSAGLPAMNEYARTLGLDGVSITAEPHVAGAGQFRGHSNPIGMGLATRAIQYVLAQYGIGYTQQTWEMFRDRVAAEKAR